MKSCSVNDFMRALAPWLDGDYIREAHLDGEGQIVLRFRDGVKNVYRIDDCSPEQKEKILKDLKEKGIPIV